MSNKEFSIEKAAELLRESKSLFTTVFKHGTLVVEFYKPEKTDHQKPHDRDEIYVVASGTGTFYNGGDRWQFKAGDFLFVPAGVEHRFESFSTDFSTWVFFMDLWVEKKKFSVHARALISATEFAAHSERRPEKFNIISKHQALIAATGSIRAAISAGTNPETMPMVVETPNPKTIFRMVSTTSRLPKGIKVSR